MEHSVVSREEWLAARQELLVQEKAHTRERARLAEARRDLPWVKVEKIYDFITEEGPMSLAELFLDQSQLVIYHFMFAPDWEKPCPGCTEWGEAMTGTTHRFPGTDARLIAVSRGPLEKLLVEKERRGWDFPWVSSADSDFNIDFHASAVEPQEETRQFGIEKVEFWHGENHGVSVFFKDENGAVYHTYSCYNRGIEAMNGAFGYYDVLPNGRPW